MYDTEDFTDDHVELDSTGNNNHYNHRPNIPGKELLISTASLNTLHVKKINLNFLNLLQIQAGEYEEYRESYSCSHLPIGTQTTNSTNDTVGRT